MTTAPRPSTAERLAVAAGALALAALAYQAARKALREHGSDFTCYLDAGAAARAGGTPYDTTAYFEYVYSPCFAAAMAPLSTLPTVVASLLWSLLTAAAAVYTVRELRAAAHGPAGRRPDDVLAMALLASIAFRIVHANFVNGQVNLIVVGMCAAFLSALQRRCDALAGLWLALAVQTKSVPILLLGLLVVRGRWRALAWTALFGALTTAAPVAIWGSQTVAIYQDWFAMLDHKLRTYTVDMGAFTTDAEGNREYFTLRGMLATLWPATSPSAVAKYACHAVVVGATVGCDLWLRRRGAPLATAATFCLWLLAALLTSPMSEKHHLALLLPGVTLGLYALLADRRRAAAVAHAATVAVPVLLSKAWPHGPFFFVAIVATFAWVVRAAGSARDLGQRGGGR